MNLWERVRTSRSYASQTITRIQSFVVCYCRYFLSTDSIAYLCAPRCASVVNAVRSALAYERDLGASERCLCGHSCTSSQPTTGSSGDAEKLAEDQCREKLCTGPSFSVASADDQISVRTTISVGVMVTTFTEDGRRPRERFETVPAVEMTVPRFVCST